MGHPSTKIFKQMIPFVKESPDTCETCVKGKMSRLPFYNSESRTGRCFELIHSNVWGSTPIEGLNNKKYFVMYMDIHDE